MWLAPFKVQVCHNKFGWAFESQTAVYTSKLSLFH